MLEEGKDYDLVVRQGTHLWEQGEMYMKVRIMKINTYGILCHRYDTGRYTRGGEDYGSKMIQINFNEIDTITPLR